MGKVIRCGCNFAAAPSALHFFYAGNSAYCMHKRKKKGKCGMLKHKIGLYSVVDGFLCYGSQQILNPAMAVICDGECCIVPKIGGKTIVLEKERISVD